MGELTRIDGIVIVMYNGDNVQHNEPHIHIKCSNGDKASISIASGSILAGEIDRKSLKTVRKWMIANKVTLWSRWNDAISMEFIKRMD